LHRHRHESGQWQGYFAQAQVDLEMMVKAGMTPMQVRRTGGAARVMKLEQQLGTIQPGKRADLLVLNANALSDIRDPREIHSVWIAGRRLNQGS
jgi:imidazolonepropionase-like amidohydrolase